MLTLLRAEDSLPEERTSGIYATVPRTSADRALAELRDITGEQPVAVLLSAMQGGAPTSACYPPRPKRIEGGYPLTHRLSSFLHPFTRSALAEVPSYLKLWFPYPKVIVIPACTPAWVAGVFVTTVECAAHAADLRALAADLALRLEIADRRDRIDLLGMTESRR